MKVLVEYYYGNDDDDDDDVDVDERCWSVCVSNEVE